MAKISSVGYEGNKHVTRGWGHEVWIENDELYTGKVLHLTKGKRGSLHFHVSKTETMFLIKGKVSLLLIDPTNGEEYFRHLALYDSIKIPRGQVHQIIAHEDSELVEFSTHHEEDDSYRVKKGD